MKLHDAAMVYGLIPASPVHELEGFARLHDPSRSSFRTTAALSPLLNDLFQAMAAYGSVIRDFELSNRYNAYVGKQRMPDALIHIRSVAPKYSAAVGRLAVVSVGRDNRLIIHRGSSSGLDDRVIVRLRFDPEWCAGYTELPPWQRTPWGIATIELQAALGLP